MTPDPRTIATEVRAIYREWELRPLERACTGRGDCCRFRHTGRTPFLTKGEALVAAMAWRAAGRTEVQEAPDGACPFLKNNRCQIYEGRPFGCRTHFCDAAGAHGKMVNQLDSDDYQWPAGKMPDFLGRHPRPPHRWFPGQKIAKCLMVAVAEVVGEEGIVGV